MTSRWRQQEVKRPSTWRQSLLFNSLILLLPILAAQIIIRAYTSDIATDPMSLEARQETRQEIEAEFRDLSGPVGSERAFWAERISQMLTERDFSAARGYLLAAPMMLNKQDAAAVLAAADAEDTGNRDQRLARAALFFLPDDVRANYQRSIAPPDVPTPSNSDAETEAAALPSDEALEEDAAIAAEKVQPLPEAAPLMNEPFAGKRSFFLLGDPADLTRRSQRWIAGEQVDSMQLRLRALGLMTQNEATPEAQDFFVAASVLRAAHRSGRLNERFERYLETRIEQALPEEALRVKLVEAFEPVVTTERRASAVLAAYQGSLQADARARLARDMEIIARLVELSSSTGAMTLVEQVTTPEDMRRALLVAEAGGHRAVALAREQGSEVLKHAQLGAKWTRALILQVMALMALGMALVWTTMSALTQAETVRTRS